MLSFPQCEPMGTTGQPSVRAFSVCCEGRSGRSSPPMVSLRERRRRRVSGSRRTVGPAWRLWTGADEGLRGAARLRSCGEPLLRTGTHRKQTLHSAPLSSRRRGLSLSSRLLPVLPPSPRGTGLRTSGRVSVHGMGCDRRPNRRSCLPRRNPQDARLYCPLPHRLSLSRSLRLRRRFFLFFARGFFSPSTCNRMPIH